MKQFILEIDDVCFSKEEKEFLIRLGIQPIGINSIEKLTDLMVAKMYIRKDLADEKHISLKELKQIFIKKEE